MNNREKETEMAEQWIETASSDELVEVLGKSGRSPAYVARLLAVLTEEGLVIGKPVAPQRGFDDGDAMAEPELSEYGRGREDGLAEYADRQLRATALAHAVHLTAQGEITVPASGPLQSVKYSDPLGLAKSFLSFLVKG